jgi:hypothetical protein
MVIGVGVMGKWGGGAEGGQQAACWQASPTMLLVWYTLSCRPWGVLNASN